MRAENAVSPEDLAALEQARTTLTEQQDAARFLTELLDGV